jgi:hypothetical protein
MAHGATAPLALSVRVSFGVESICGMPSMRLPNNYKFKSARLNT